MTPTSPKVAAFMMAGLLSMVPLAEAAGPMQLTGSIAGQVRNGSGVGQMGATVILLNRYDKTVRQILTDDKGQFVFDSLLPDLYSLRVSLASFVPAFKRGISVQPGLQNVLTINLAGVLSSIELVYTAPQTGTLMSDEWKWVLRSSQATRPVLRFHDVIFREPSRDEESHARVFSETRGVVRVSAGDGGSYAGAGMQPDLGTAFALATSLFGSNQLEFSGNVGYSSRAGMPMAGFRTTYSRSGGPISSPEVIITMRQLALPSRGGFGPGATTDGYPALRTASATLMNQARIMDNVTMDYGMTVDSVSMISRLNMVSGFGRLNYDLGPTGIIKIAYTTGAPPVELAQHTAERNASEQELSDDLSALAALPLVSIRDAQPRVQRSESFEVGYTKVSGKRTYSFGAYRERMNDAILTMAGNPGFDGRDLLADIGSESSIFDAGNFDRWGYMASVTQAITDKLDVALAYGRGGALSMVGNPGSVPTPDELRSSLEMMHRNWATIRLSGTAPGTGTRFVASYGWMDTGTIMPARISLTQPIGPEPGLNLSVRQPIPCGGIFPGRLEAVGEMRNLMAQGYLPVPTASGRTAVLTNSPRSVRGGLAFIF